MPVEIRELVIRTVVGDAADPAPGAATSGGQAQPSQPEGIDFDLLVQECVRQVLQVLARERGR